MPNALGLNLTSGAPANWQDLVDYLREERITDSPRFEFSSQRADLPKSISVRLASRSDFSDTDGNEVTRFGFGSTTSPEETLSRAVGELLERYCLSVYRRKDLSALSYRDAVARRKRPLNILELNDFSPWQKENRPQLGRSSDRVVRWVLGKNIVTGASALLPAQLIYWNYRFDADEMILGEPNTNGGAGHFTRDEAIRSALLELIQRDGFLIYWLNQLPPKRIDTSTIIDPEIKTFLAYLRRYRLEYHFLNVTTDLGVPACVCVLVDHSAPGGPLIGIGGAAGFSLKELIMQSADEAISIIGGAIDHEPYRLPKAYVPFKNSSVGRSERLSLWRGREMYERFEFFLQGPLQSFEGFMGDTTWHDTPAKQLSYILSRLASLGEGYEPYVYEAEHPILQALGFHVVKVIVPRLVSLYLRERMAPLGALRLKETPKKLGYEAAESPNPWPHPFP